MLTITSGSDLVVENVASVQGAPKVEESEVEVVPHERIGELVDKLRGRTMYARAITSLFTGMRRGEVLAPRWQYVDLGGAQIRWPRRSRKPRTAAYG